METLFGLQLLRMSLTNTDNFWNSREHGERKECSKAITSSPKNHLYFEIMVFLISKLVHVFTYIFPINSSRNIDYVETALLIPLSDFMTEITVLGIKKTPCFGFQVFIRVFTTHSYGISSKSTCLSFQKHLVLEVFPCQVISGQNTES